MIDALLFDKDGTLFDFRLSWGGWAAAFLPTLARDAGHARRLGQAIGFDAPSRSFAPDSPVIAGTAAEIACALLPELPGTAYRPVFRTAHHLALFRTRFAGTLRRANLTQP